MLIIFIIVRIAWCFGNHLFYRSFQTRWLIIKLLELVTLLAGCVLLITENRQKYIGLMPIGVCFFLIGNSFSLCVWDICEKMVEPENRSFSLEDELAVPKALPCYDSFFKSNTNIIFIVAKLKTTRFDQMILHLCLNVFLLVLIEYSYMKIK